MKVLDIGSGPNSVASITFEGAEILRLDIDPELNPDVLHDITKPFPPELHGQFDAIYCSHVLEHIPRAQVIGTVMNMLAPLRVGGELWVIVPSLEWAAREILKDQPSSVMIPHIFGSQSNEWQYHRCGFTLNLLRQIFELAGFVPRQAYQAPFIITSSGKDFPSLQNIVVGMKYEEQHE